MAVDAIVQLEKLVDQLLAERANLQGHNRDLTEECDRLVKDRSRVSAELDKLLAKLKSLEEGSQ